MALKIRLARGGTKKRPIYRIVVADVRAPRDGRFIEKVGTYNPLLPKDSEDRVTMNLERISHWISHGAKPTDRVLRFLDAAGILKREPRNNPNKAIPKAERKKEESAPAPKGTANATAKDDAGKVEESKETKDTGVEEKVSAEEEKTGKDESNKADETAEAKDTGDAEETDAAKETSGKSKSDEAGDNGEAKDADAEKPKGKDKSANSGKDDKPDDATKSDGSDDAKDEASPGT